VTTRAITAGRRRFTVILPLPARPIVDVVVPVYNEERDLEPSVRRLHRALREQLPYPSQITIADNGSSDGTGAIADRLGVQLPHVRVLHLNEKGRGRALAAAWMTSGATVVAYTDVDLSTDLGALLPLVAPIVSGHSEVSIGSRLIQGARVSRSMKRELISRCYNLVLRTVLRVKFRDAQCGFKALRADVARRLIPTVVNRNWFFDTELLVRAERAGMRILELPVDWNDDPDSRVDIIATALEDLRGVWRLATGKLMEAPARLGSQLVRFAVVGALSTAAYAALYWVLRDSLPAPVSNTIALAVTAIGNTAANRRFTFGITGRERLLRDHAGGLIAFGVALALTNIAIISLGALSPAAPRAAEIALLSVINAIATLIRFLVLRMMLVHLRPSPVEVAP
jgi:putative flippase GtrA